MITRSLFAFCGLFLSFVSFAQTLTISSSGQSSAPFTNITVSGNTWTVTGTANVTSSAVVNALNSGSLTIVGSSTSFQVSLSQAVSSTTSGSGLIIGSSTNTGNITISSALSVAGPITLMGGAIAVNANLTSTASNADILVKATTNINQASSVTVTTAAGAVSYWADSDNNSTGYVQLKSSSSISTNGGAISLGGGSDLTTDFAFGTTSETCSEDPNLYISGVHIQAAVQLNSGGGHISLRGQSATNATSNMAFGVSIRGDGSTPSSIISGAGKIAIHGVVTGSGTVNGQGASTWGSVTLRSANTTADAISVIGDASALNMGTNGASLGINFTGLFEATAAGGGITFNGKAGTANTVTGLNLSGSVLAHSGPITFIGESTNNVQSVYFGADLWVGKKAGTNVTSSSSNVVIETNNIVIGNATHLIDCSGSFTFRSLGTSFPSSFSWPLANLTLASSVSGLTIGKTNNTADVTIGTATSIAGPITLYGGQININQNLTSTGLNQAILLKASSHVLVASGKSIVSNGGNILLWSDSDNNNSGGIKIDDNVTIDARTNTDRTANTHTSGGGKVILAGGLDDGGSASGTSSILTGLVANDGIPDGYAANSGSSATQSGIVLGTSSTGTGHNCAVSIFSGGGDIRFHALATNNSSSVNNGPTGLLFYEGYTINGGNSGNITLLGNSNLTSGSWAIGMDLAAWRTSTASANGTTRTVSGNINIIGRAAGGSSGNIAIAIDGDGNRHVFAATGSGTISVDGLASGPSQTDVRITNVDMLSASGAITITAKGNSGVSVGGYAIGNGLYLGKKAGSLVTSSTSNISIITNNLSTSSKPLAVDGTGEFVIEPYSASFASAFTLNSTQTIASTLGGLRIGKSGNTADITISTAQSINGPITLHGGTLGLSAALTTTNASTGNIGLNGTTLSGNSNLTLASGRTATMNLSSAASYSGTISGSTSNFVKSGIGTLTLTGANTYDGTTTVSAGSLILNRTGGSTLASAGDLALTGGNLTVSTAQTLNDVNVNSGTLTTNAGISFTVDGTFAGGGTLANNGTFILLGPATLPGAPFMAVPVTFPGASTTISAMNNLTINNLYDVELDKDIAVTGTLSLAAGTFNLLSKTLTVSGNVTRSSGSIDADQGNVVFSNASNISLPTSIFSGTVAGLSKTSGAGTVTMNDHLTVTGDLSTTASTGAWIMASSKQLTVNGTLTNNGIFTLKDGATFVPGTSGTSVLGTGTFNVEKQLTGNATTWDSPNNVGRFWYMGVPMNSVARSSFGTQGATTNRVWSYSEVTKQYTEISSSSAPLTGGTGYVHRRNDNNLFTFSATGTDGLRGTDLTLSGLTRTSGSSVGFNLVANPYMAYLDWDAITKTNVEETYYIRSHNSNSNDISALITFNGSSNVLTNNSSLTLSAAQMNYIAPLQAIWVRVGPNSGTGSLTMTRSMLSHQTGNPGLKTSTVFPTLARVNLLDGARFDQMLVYLNQDMSNAVDQYDSEKMFVSGAPQLYTMVAGKKLVMNGLNSNKKKISVPLYLELPTSKVYELQLSEYLLEDGLILLEDKQEGTIQDFTINDTYAFYGNSGVLSNRFVLHFYMPDAAITAQGPSNSWVEQETSYTEGGNVQITADSKGKVQISLDQAETDKAEGTVQATDANGRVVYSGALEGQVTMLELNVPSGVYYLTVQSGNMIEKKKVFIQD